MILRSRALLPITQPPLDNGAVVISGQHIEWVGSWHPRLKTADQTVVDLGDCLLLPGLVNAHCHLDYTDMAGQISPPRSFSDFIKCILALKAAWTMEDYRRSWLRGAEMLLRNGVTTVADIEAVPALLPLVRPHTPLRLYSFLELIGLRNQPPPEETLRQALDPIRDLPVFPGNIPAPPLPPRNFEPPKVILPTECPSSMPGTTQEEHPREQPSVPPPERWSAQKIGLSPHAPYSTTPELLRLCVNVCRQYQWRYCTHVAESQEEYDLVSEARGTMFDWLKNQRDVVEYGQGSPVCYLEKQGFLGENLLAVHANYLASDDAQKLGRHQVSVAHCPRSHAFFGHQAFPLSALSRAGVNICLGTDSLVTVRSAHGENLELNLFAELHAFAARANGLSPTEMVRLVTVNGAHALGWSGQVGQLTPQAWADLIAVPFSGNARGACEALLYHTGPVSATMIGGQWVFPPTGRVL